MQALTKNLNFMESKFMHGSSGNAAYPSSNWKPQARPSQTNNNCQGKVCPSSAVPWTNNSPNISPANTDDQAHLLPSLQHIFDKFSSFFLMQASILSPSTHMILPGPQFAENTSSNSDMQHWLNGCSWTQLNPLSSWVSKGHTSNHIFFARFALTKLSFNTNI